MERPTIHELSDVNAQVLVGTGRHAWKDVRLVVGHWRAHPQSPWEGVLMIDKEHADAGPKVPLNRPVDLRIRGEEGARIWGMWFLEPVSCGELRKVTCATEKTLASDATLQVWGGPWRLETCEVRSTGGCTIIASAAAVLMCETCGIGGLEVGKKNELWEWDLNEGIERGGWSAVR